ncbi:MAG: thrombospondin type 3 repeat-containing protein, partial [Anaerolineales bacterium]|nr:thrombospondin type 3 repeat-containing protein [Anaerolineales bacterium]
QAAPDDDILTTTHTAVRQTGSYEFTADIIQHTIPVADVTTIGRASQRQEMHLQGETNLQQDHLTMTLWAQGGTLLDEQSGLEVEVAEGRTRVRRPGEAWQTYSDFSEGFMPDGDFLTYLAGADDLTPLGTEGELTGYTYRLDGRRLTAVLRDQLTEELARTGELLPGQQVDLPTYMKELTGEGELWLAPTGLPVRQTVTLRFPEQDGVWIQTDIDVLFTDFGQPVQVTLLQAMAAPWLSGVIPAFLLGVLTVSGLVLTAVWLSRYQPDLAYRLFTALCIFSLLISPFYFVLRAEAATLVRADRLAQSEASQAPSDAASAQQEALQTQREHALRLRSPQTLAQIRADEGQDSDHDGYSDTQETLLGTNPAVADAPDFALLPHVRGLTSSTDTTDTDGDGLTDYEEILLGTNPDLPDTDADLIPDGEEIAGFTYNGQLWHTDPLEPDSNHDGLSDTQEWNDPDRFHPTWDLDQDGVPDLFDRDNDGDGVPDYLDTSPFTKSDTRYDADNPFSFALQGLTPGERVNVEIQLRPDNPDHLWYALKQLDWPRDTRGQIKDVDGSRDDVSLVPMLEITMPEATTNLPTAVPSLPVTVHPTENLRQNGLTPTGGQGILRQQGDDIILTDANFETGGSLILRTGSCLEPGDIVREGIAITSNGKFVIGEFADLSLRQLSQGGYTLQMYRFDQRVMYGCGNIYPRPYNGADDSRMIDVDELSAYNISVRDTAVGEQAGQVMYVPLHLMVDDPAQLTVKTNSDEVIGGRVGFRALIPYQAAAQWGEAHQVRLVWAVQMKLDEMCVERTPFLQFEGGCGRTVNNLNTLIHSYDDAWRLTGFNVYEEIEVEHAIIYEDPAVDEDVHDDLTLTALADGLDYTFMAGRTDAETGQRDMTIDEIARRFDHTTNDTVTEAERWRLPDTLGVVTSTHESLTFLARDSSALTTAVLDDHFTPAWSTNDP